MECAGRSHGKFPSSQWFPASNKINNMNEVGLDLFVRKQRSYITSQQEQCVATVLDSFAALRQELLSCSSKRNLNLVNIILLNCHIQLYPVLSVQKAFRYI